MSSNLPRLGLGTWRMGERSDRRAAEVAALRHGLDLGVELIDTAEMYGDGRAEAIVGEAIAGRRDQVVLVSKCYPHHAGARTMPGACDASLARLRVERIDCYLLHWRGRVPLAETVDAFERLVRAGKIARWGVSNFDVGDMDELFAVPGGRGCMTNQVLYSLEHREPEWRLLEHCRRNGVSLMAYSPLGQGGLALHPALSAIAKRRGMTAAQLALAFVLDRPGVTAIPKAVARAHVDDDVAASRIELDDATRAELDAAFPPPRRASRIALA